MRIDFLATMAHHVQKATANRGMFPGREGMYPPLVEWWFDFQTDAAKLQIPLRVVWGVRTAEQQAEMLRRKVTRAGPGQSPHNYGMALDIIHTTRAWNSMPPEGWEYLGALGKEAARKRKLKLSWGGDWGRVNGGLGWDAAHWEIADWRTRINKA